MDIYFKCSFKYGIGYRIGKYSADFDTLTYIPEKDDSIQRNMSRTVAGTLGTELGRSMVLATDENRQLFMGVYRLILGDYDKYVNAVFVGSTPQETFQMFLYFCSKNYCGANAALLSCIVRDKSADDGTGFLVDIAQIHSLLDDAQKVDCGEIPLDSQRSALLAFVSQESYQDYQIGLEQIFTGPPTVEYKNIDSCVLEAVSIEAIQKGLMRHIKKRIQIMTVLVLLIAAALTAVIGFYFLSEEKYPQLPDPAQTSRTSSGIVAENE